MSGVKIDLSAARAALSAAASRAEVLLASVPYADMPTCGLDWTVGETSAHLVGDVGQFADMAMERRVAEGGIDQVRSLNAGHLVRVREREPAVVARLFADAVREFLAETGERDGGDAVSWYGGQTITVEAIACLVLGEILVHGYDIARSIGSPWPIDASEARLALDGATWTLASLLDPEAARGIRASYDIRVRGGSRLGARIEDGRLTVEAAGQRPVDCHISADPVALLLVGYGRIGQWGQITRGRLVAWGRKPWHGPRFVTLLRNP